MMAIDPGYIALAVVLFGLIAMWLRRNAPTKLSTAEREAALLVQVDNLSATVATLLAKLNEAQRELDALRAQLAQANARISELEIITAQQNARQTATRREAQLRAVLDAKFSEEELRTLASDLELDYDALPGEGKTSRARELVGWFSRRGELARLEGAVRAVRPR